MNGVVVDNPLAMGKFGDAVRRLRKAARMSQDELAQAAKVSRATIQIVEKSEEPQMYGRNYRQLAAALGKTPEQLDAEWKEAGVRLIEVSAEVAALIDRNAASAKMEAGEWLRVLLTQPPQPFNGTIGFNPRPTRKGGSGSGAKETAEKSAKQS